MGHTFKSISLLQCLLEVWIENVVCNEDKWNEKKEPRNSDCRDNKVHNNCARIDQEMSLSFSQVNVYCLKVFWEPIQNLAWRGHIKEVRNGSLEEPIIHFSEQFLLDSNDVNSRDKDKERKEKKRSRWEDERECEVGLDVRRNVHESKSRRPKILRRILIWLGNEIDPLEHSVVHDWSAYDCWENGENGENEDSSYSLIEEEVVEVSFPRILDLFVFFLVLWEFWDRLNPECKLHLFVGSVCVKSCGLV